MRRISAALSAIIGSIASVLSAVVGAVITVVTLPFRVLQRLLTPSRGRSARTRRRAI
ncbi:LPFR motif small protein [Spirillospora sp. CA-128828]|uniref:LPFR motif small protein n=1 Tax=Spirillospora sp. CA-128828 TaxID=3240033 RepID=UPI003D8B47E1